MRMIFSMNVSASVAVLLAMLARGLAVETTTSMPATAPQVRAAVERSLPFIAKIGSDWMENHNCNSCHVVAFQLWSHNAAAERGFTVDANKLAEWTQWALADAHSDRNWFRLRPPAVEALRADGIGEAILAKLTPLTSKNFHTEKLFLEAMEKVLSPEDFARYGQQIAKLAALPNNGGGPDTLAQLLLGRKRGGEDAATAASYEAVRKLLLQWQNPNGSWIADGQLPALRWDGEREMNDATTMWSLLAVTGNRSTDEVVARSRARALDYLRTTKPGKTLQTLALRLIVAHDFGEVGNAEPLRRELQARQNADGGWSWWKENSTSDAFATGQALYALGRIGCDGSDPAVARAWHFLVSTQGEEGGWQVPQQAINTRERRLNVYTFWGAAWATIGMLETLPNESGQR